MGSRRSVMLIANPGAGRGRSHRTAASVRDALRARGVDVTTRETSQAGDAESYARAAALASSPVDCVLACGGDGTIQEVVNGLAAAGGSSPGPALGLAPAGRCNDFARVLGVPGRVEAIADIAAFGQSQPIDLGRVNGRYFCTVATVGVDAAVSSFVDGMRMPLSGRLAYLYGALRVLLRYRARSVRLSGDFGVIQRPLFLASIANTESYGGAIPIAPGAVPTDGQLDLCVIDDVPRRRMPMLVLRVLKGRHRSCAGVTFFRTHRLTIESGEPFDLWADGERVGTTPATVEIAPGMVNVMLPLNATR